MTPREDRTDDYRISDTGHSKQSLRLWLRLLMTSTIIEKRIRLYLKKQCGTTLPRFDVLANLHRQAEPINMTQLCEKLLVSSGNVSGVVGRLVEDGLVTRHSDGKDRRIQYVEISNAGRASFLQAAGAHEALVESIFADLDDADMAALITLLDKAYARARNNLDGL